jgi:hypothetical protein
MTSRSAYFERNKNWQATARRKDGTQVAVMRGQQGGDFEWKFYLYDENWSPRLPCPLPDTDISAMRAYSAAEIKLMFESGGAFAASGQRP